MSELSAPYMNNSQSSDNAPRCDSNYIDPSECTVESYKILNTRRFHTFWESKAAVTIGETLMNRCARLCNLSVADKSLSEEKTKAIRRNHKFAKIAWIILTEIFCLWISLCNLTDTQPLKGERVTRP